MTAKQFSAWRKRTQLSWAQAAKELRCSVRTVARYEAGDCTISEGVARLCQLVEKEKSGVQS